MTLPLNSSDLYHTGIVVPDLQAEMARLLSGLAESETGLRHAAELLERARRSER